MFLTLSSLERSLTRSLILTLSAGRVVLEAERVRLFPLYIIDTLRLQCLDACLSSFECLSFNAHLSNT